MAKIGGEGYVLRES